MPDKDDKQTGDSRDHRSSPYPVSRLAPAFGKPDLAKDLELAQSMLSARTGAKLRVIADQIRSLQEEARRILENARDEQALTQAQCGFRRLPGNTYHLYRKSDGTSFFSMLSPADWGGQPPYCFLGSYRLEADYSWTAAREGEGGDDMADETGDLIDQLLRIGGIAPVDAKGDNE